MKASAMTTKNGCWGNADTITTQAIKLQYSNLLKRENNSKKIV